MAIGVPRETRTSSTERPPYGADIGASVARVRVAGAVPALDTGTVMTALPATMHCTPIGHRLSDTTDPNVTESPSPATDTASPTAREKVSPNETVRTCGVVVAGDVGGGGVVGAGVVGTGVVGADVDRGAVGVGVVVVVVVVVVVELGADVGGRVDVGAAVDDPPSPQAPAAASSATTAQDLARGRRSATRP